LCVAVKPYSHYIDGMTRVPKVQDVVSHIFGKHLAATTKRKN
jgi:molecular chaperone DnaK (HSP70)